MIIYAVFGAFLGMYGRDDPPQLRIVHQAQAAGLLLGGAILGISLAYLDTGLWELVGIEALFAAAASVYADKYGLKPTGPFFAIFALGACASVTPTVPWWCAVAICLATAVFSACIGFAGWVTDRTWSAEATRDVASLQISATLVHAFRYFLALAVAGVAGLLLGIGHPYWAMAAAAVPLAAETLNQRIRRGLHRIIGTLLGVGVTALILWHQPPVAMLVIIVIILQFPSELLMTRNYALALTFFTPMILLMTLLASPVTTETLIVDRIVETLLGSVTGILVALCIKEPRQRLAR
ncbi:hypothetical protein M2368_003542 [Arthrobacter sp. JUb119]|uniref:FUSC family protein n=1 Tax=Arthrobacter sp. JUb115 TaxID=2485108 RepID=UPI002570DFEF|nr:FUSC family protein [Arthrobacter sp. JUb115]MCS3494510.1 hypothetical protein [Arthrobacter sp. JUb119]